MGEGDKLARGKSFHGERIEIRMIFFFPSRRALKIFG